MMEKGELKMYKVIIDKINVEKAFNTYNEARHYMSETKKNWEAQINEMEWNNNDRAFLCELYWTIKIEKITK